MTWLALVEAVVICVLGLVVLALAHSYAGLAARVDATSSTPTGAAATTAPMVLSTPHRTAPTTSVRDLDGETPLGESVLVPLAGADADTLLAFLTSSCASCRSLWEELPAAQATDLPAGMRLVIVTKGVEHESPASVASLAAQAGSPDVVMSSSAWADFAVPGSPYFVLVSREDGGALGQGTALRWRQVVDLMGLAGDDNQLGARAKSRRDRRQEVDVDRILMGAGVFPGDPSLYPTDRDATHA